MDCRKQLQFGVQSDPSAFTPDRLPTRRYSGFLTKTINVCPESSRASTARSRSDKIRSPKSKYTVTMSRTANFSSDYSATSSTNKISTLSKAYTNTKSVATSKRCGYLTSINSARTSDFLTERNEYKTRYNSIKTSSSDESDSDMTMKTSKTRNPLGCPSKRNKWIQTSNSNLPMLPLPAKFKLCAKPNATSIPKSTHVGYKIPSKSSCISPSSSRNLRIKTDSSDYSESSDLSDYSESSDSSDTSTFFLRKPKKPYILKESSTTTLVSTKCGSNSSQSSSLLSENDTCESGSKSSQTTTHLAKKVKCKNASKQIHNSSILSKTSKHKDRSKYTQTQKSQKNTSSLKSSHSDQDYYEIPFYKFGNLKFIIIEDTAESTSTCTTNIPAFTPKFTKRQNNNKFCSKSDTISQNNSCSSTMTSCSTVSPSTDSYSWPRFPTPSYVTSSIDTSNSVKKQITCPHCGKKDFPVFRRQKNLAKAKVGGFWVLNCWPCCLLPFMGSSRAGQIHVYCKSCKNLIGNFNFDKHVKQSPPQYRTPRRQ